MMILNTIILMVSIIILYLVYEHLWMKRFKVSPIENFKKWLVKEDVVILDTETTGFRKNDEIIEIAIINTKGETLLDKRVMPNCPIPIEATDIHGLTKRKLKGSPSWSEIHDEVMTVLEGKTIVAYNSEFDIRLLRQTMKTHGQKIPYLQHECAMKMYAKYRAVPDKRHKNFKWHKLTQAARFEKIEVKNAHNALGDCLMTLNLIRAVSLRDEN